ncbi:origin recognition complex subunit 6 [Brienomyrus brachyistius]|uniref:origin recognition complex subunit 6 n=1 Tax=Brienomyrus brachyistius TaxID=42636 RepID=UPI0020B32912|nr:origin recognition complex subunit 6 [Brienomyrus brachyistius]
MEKQMFNKLASKMGITSAKILRQAEEYFRLSQIRCTGLGNTTVTSKTVICLELAATTMRHPLDKDYVIKLSGLNKNVYRSSLKSMECILGLESHLGLRDMAVQYGCMQAAEPAAKILQRYEASLPESQQACLDLSTALFTTAALLTACRCMKIKVDRKLASSSGAKKGMLDRLCVQLQKFGQEICSEMRTGTAAVKDQPKTARKRQKTLQEVIEQREEVLEEELLKSPKQHKADSDEPVKQNYEEWKKSVLENALKATGVESNFKVG